MQRILKRLKARLAPVLQSDTAFVEAAFREVLGRNADLDGLTHYRRVLNEGLGRTAVLLDMMRSEEFRAKLMPLAPGLPDLRAVRPDRYRTATDRTNGQAIPVFEAEAVADFDWLEQAIVTYGYYEQPGVWTLDVDADKRVVAEMLSAFAPARALELGCAAGAVLDCLEDYQVLAEGVEISTMALARAAPRVRGRIHQGDLLSLALTPGYDLVFGLDVFEHLNPNKLDAYVARIAEITAEGAYLFCNIPAFGADEVFGTVFPMYIDGWEAAAAQARPFSTLQVDPYGYPVHGHLTWADAKWWCKKFEAQGFHREIEIERALHLKYDDYMVKYAPARRSYFVFTNRPSPQRRDELIESIRREKSKLTV